MLIIHDVEQGSQEWLDLRLGLPTASNAQLLLVNGTGQYKPMGDGALTYICTKATEDYEEESQDDFCGNEHTERGHEYEPILAQLYIDSGYNQGEPVTTAGIGINYGMGASPDRLVGNKGGLEIKSMVGKKLFRLKATKKIDKAHIAQCQANMMVWEREWWDYIVGCEGHTPFIHRFKRDETMIKKLVERVELFHELKNKIIGL